MKCPVCSNVLREMKVKDITVDVCEGGCGGIWFDQFELKKFDEPHESAGEYLLDIARDKKITIDRSKKIKCPKCNNIVMMRHFFSAKKQVEVDECPGCGGFWLDCGELREIRSLFSSEEERNKATDAFFSEIFDVQLASLKQQTREKFGTAGKIAQMFGLIWPSYYSPTAWRQIWRKNDAEP